jgi:hypothetical protein
MPVAYQFANASTTIPLSQLDANFASPITLGNTSIQLGNSVSTLNNMTLANVTISSGNIAFAIPATSGGTGLVSPGTTGNVLTSNGTAWVSTGAAAGTGVTALSFGSTGLTPSTATSGNVTVSGTLSVGSGGTGLQSLTSNSVLLGNGSSTIQFVSPGSSGNVLTSNGTTWSSVAPSGGGGGAMTLISTKSTNGVVSVSWTGLSGYNNYILILDGFNPNSVQPYLQVGTGSTSWLTSSYSLWWGWAYTNSWNLSTARDSKSDFWDFTFTSFPGPVNGSVSFLNMTNSLYTTTISNLSLNNLGGPLTNGLLLQNGRNESTTAKTAIRLIASDGTTNFAGGTASLYGISS